MNSIACKNCFAKCRNDIGPREIDCGHKICSECSTTCIESSAGCPVCKRGLTKSNETDNPINYEFMKKNSATTEKYLKKMANTMNKELIENLSKITNGLHSIENLFLLDDFDATETEMTLSDLEKMMVLKTKLQGSVTHQRYGYASDQDFIYDIYKRISRNEVFYAVINIDGETKFARLSVLSLENKIALHAFGPPVLGKDINTVMFADLKRIFSSFTPNVFLQANGCKFIIKTMDLKIASQFTKYCTGELGPVYKGAPIRKCDILDQKKLGYYMMVDNFMMNGVGSKGNFEFMVDTPFNRKYKTGDIICLAYIDGSFQLMDTQGLDDDSIHFPCFSDCSVIGIIEKQNNLFNRSFNSYEGGSIINDSGIVLDLKTIRKLNCL